MEELYLWQIVEYNDMQDKVVSYQSMHRYLKSLYIYYKEMFCCEPMLMVTNVFNAVQYCKIVESEDFYEAIDRHLKFTNLSDEEKEHQAELISFNSKLLKDLIYESNRVSKKRNTIGS